MEYQTLSEQLPPVWSRKSSDWLIDLAFRLKEHEQGESDNTATDIEIWHQVILLAKAELQGLQPQPSKDSLFKQDYYVWVKEQIRLLHLKQFEQLDIEHLPDELHDLAWLIEREIESNLAVTCNHLLKYKYARKYLKDEPCCDSWRSALHESRSKIAQELEDSPSLQDYPSQKLDFCYQLATSQVYRETKLFEGDLPATCPWSVNQILDHDWLPDKVGYLRGK